MLPKKLRAADTLRRLRHASAGLAGAALLGLPGGEALAQEPIPAPVARQPVLTPLAVDDGWPFLKPRESIIDPLDPAAGPARGDEPLSEPDALNYEKLIAGGDDVPPGFVGRRRPHPPDLVGSDYFPIEDRWRLGFPVWDRYAYGSLLDPYYQNVLKGDYPIKGQDIFFTFTGFENLFLEAREVPFKDGKNIKPDQIKNDFFATFDLFQGDNSFHPSEWLVRITLAFEFADVAHVPTEGDAALQELFIDKQLAIVSPYYDTVNLRVGRQGFNFDFRGLLFADVNDAVRLFGNYDANRTQWNIFAFNLVEKDVISQFNTFDTRHQLIAGANLFRQDFIFQGFNVEAGVLYDADRIKNHVDAVYFELAGDGHIGRFNVSTALICAVGRDEFNPVAKRETTLNSQLFALELAYQLDWFIPKISFLYASGDANASDGNARGFDAPFDNPFFGGAGFSYLQREAVAPGGVILANTFSFLPSLRTKTNDPVNFVNPGLLLFNTGFDALITTRLTTQFNINAYRIVHADPVNTKFEQLNGRPVLAGKELGAEFNLGVVYKPLIIDNFVIVVGSSVLYPGATIKDLNAGNGEPLYTVFSAVTLVY